MSRKMVVALATTHQLQAQGHPSNPKLGAAINLIRDKHPFGVITEEWFGDHPSFASTLATPTLKWVNVGTPRHTQYQTWSRGLNCEPMDHDTSKPMLPEYGPVEVQERREAFMASRIIEAMTSYNCGLFIVGLAHLHSMLTKLQCGDLDVKGFSWLE
jgi:hypothetical protein